jgi:hypothetical protein
MPTRVPQGLAHAVAQELGVRFPTWTIHDHDDEKKRVQEPDACVMLHEADRQSSATVMNTVSFITDWSLPLHPHRPRTLHLWIERRQQPVPEEYCLMLAVSRLTIED